MEQTTTSGDAKPAFKQQITNGDSSKNFDIEDVFEECGGYGRFQFALSVIVVFYTINNAMSYMFMVYIGVHVPFTCLPPKFNESLIPENITSEQFLHLLNYKEDQCSVFDLQMNGSYYDIPSINSSTSARHNCKRRQFDTRYLSSIVSEYDLACERRWLKNTAFTTLFFGCLAGSLGSGILADRFGRHLIFFVGLVIFLIANMIKVHSPYLVLFDIMYFFEGVGQAASYFCSYTLAIELLSQRHRMRINFILHVSFSVGSMILAGIAYTVRQWHYLQYAISLPHILFFLLWKWLPESPRWLLSKKRFEEAENSFIRMAKTNKRGVNGMLKILREDVIGKEGTELNGKMKMLPENDDKRPVGQKKTCTVLDLIIKPRRAFISLNIWLCWFVVSMLYYGVTINSVDMAGDPYINFFLMSLIEVPAGLICSFCFDWFGHRKPICFFMVFGGINCIASNFVTKGSYWYPLILAVLGKFGATASFGGLYLLSAEIFPTIIRISSMGTASTFGRLGAISAPAILGFSTYASWLPFSIFGVLGILFGLLTLLLPEVKNTALPQTVEDMENL